MCIALAVIGYVIFLATFVVGWMRFGAMVKRKEDQCSS